MNQKIYRIGLLIMAAVIAVLPYTVWGSLPVEYAMVGCIKGDKFYINSEVSPGLAGFPIKALDGKTIRVEGYLSPGDHFQADTLFIVDNVCREDLHKKYFLCNPCRTRLNGPPPKAVPRKEKGIAVQVSPEVIRQFDNLPRLMRGIHNR